MADPQIDAQLLRDIMTPDDCPGTLDLPTWASLLANGTVLFLNPFLAVAVITSQLAADVLRLTCNSKVRMAAIVAASARNVPEAVPAFITLLGGEFIEGVTVAGKKSVVFHLRQDRAIPVAAVRSLLVAGIAKIIASRAGVLPGEVLVAAREALAEAATSDPDATVRQVAATSLIKLDVALPQLSPQQTQAKLRAAVPWVLVGVLSLGAGALWLLARHYDNRGTLRE